jgi:hypothetical protein
MSQTLTNLEMLALAKLVKLADVNDETTLPPGTAAFVNFSVDVEGNIERGPSSTRAGTNRARSVPTICLLLHELGCTREYAPDHIIDLWNRLAGLSKQAVESHLSALTSAEQSNYRSMLDLFDAEIVDNIPRIPTKGYLKFRGTAKKA